MYNFSNAAVREQEHQSVHGFRYIPLAAGLVAIALTYLAASAERGLFAVAATISIAAAFAAVSVLAGTRKSRSPEPSAPNPTDDEVFDEIEDRLIALDEAQEVFGTSLNAADMFRLVSSRIAEIFPLEGTALVAPSAGKAMLRYLYCDGPDLDLLRGQEVPAGSGSAGLAFLTAEIVIDNELKLDGALLGPERLSYFDSTIAVPLLQNGSPFAVLQIFSAGRIPNGGETMRLLEAIRERVTPIFESSLAFERTLSSALTDPLTGLPNERAFYMVLENQLAESLRNRGERPLTILSIDIRDFGAVNSMLGHAVGDRMLEFAGQRIGECLRKMDFLARSINDEFNVILPTASEKKAFEIIERMRSVFVQNEFEIADGEGVSIALNLGWATFWNDGETAEQLIRTAQQRKREAKSQEPAGVLWFPREYVN